MAWDTERRKMYNREKRAMAKASKERREAERLDEAAFHYKPPPVPLPLYPLDGALVFCVTFGCGRTLSLQETLFGTTCINCRK